MNRWPQKDNMMDWIHDLPDEIIKRSHEDPALYAALRRAAAEGRTYTQALELAVCALSDCKSSAIDEHLRTLRQSPGPPIIIKHSHEAG